MSSAQVRLSDYLQYELYHSIGAYSIARERLLGLERRLEEARRAAAYDGTGEEERRPAAYDGTGEDPLDQDDLLRVTRLSREYNEQLARERHSSRHTATGMPREVRHPIPDQLPLSLRARFDVEDGKPNIENARVNPWTRPMAWAWIANFYDAAMSSLDLTADQDALAALQQENPRIAGLSETFAKNIALPRDRMFRPRPTEQDIAEGRRWRRARFKARCERALEQLPGTTGDIPSRTGGPNEFLHRIATDNLSSGWGSLPLFVVNVLAESHLSMHAVEAWYSMSLGAHAEKLTRDRRQWLTRELDRCIVLDTFVYSAGRCAPWMFAEDDAECTYVFEHFETAWQNAVPTRCMWIAAQVSLLALHRRAFSRATKGERTDAYNDYHKLQQQIRDARRRLDSAPVHIAGAVEFLTALDARANQNIGELYRAEHAQQPALKHFQTALDRLEAVRGHGEMDEVLTNSRWYVELQISQGKASYEMGRHKDCLRWHLEGWRAFLNLLAADTETEANTEFIDKAIAWLEEIKFEPELRKTEVQRYVRPIIDQLDRITIHSRLGALAAEILLRLGHVLFVLNIGLDEAPPSIAHLSDAEEKAAWNKRIADTMAFGCLTKAAECDEFSTLAGADLLKARYRFADWIHRHDTQFPEHLREALKLPEMKAIDVQWPRGGEDYALVTRVAEYLMLLARLHPDGTRDRRDGTPIEQQDTKVASDLLLNFFMHTDSISVRKSQVHRFLMRRPACAERPTKPSEPAIEFVCMRRYSSAFPLLPRPAAFRAHGGGYFVRLHSTQPGPPLGIVVDPGFDYIENLYRTGFSLSDIDMIVVTHDHADHLSSLESLLSLLHYRSGLLPEQATDDPPGSGTPGTPAPNPRKPPPLVYGNASICARFQTVCNLHPAEHFKSLEEGVALPKRFKEFQLIAMSSADVDGRGHRDLSDQPSYGICFNHRRERFSLAITSDTPAPPDRVENPAQHTHWRRTWRPALEADVLVAHMSTVPLTELRQIAKVDARNMAPRSEDVTRLAELTAQTLARTDATIEQVAAMKRTEIEERIAAIDARLVQIEQQCSDAGTPVSADPDHALLLKERRDLTGELVRFESLELPVSALRASFLELQQAVAELRAELPPYSADRDKLQGATRATKEAAKNIETKRRDLEPVLECIDHRPVLRSGLMRLDLDARTLALEADNPTREADDLERIREQLQDADDDLRGQIEFGLWLRSRAPGPLADLVGLVHRDPKDLTRDWKPPRDHPYLRGTLAWARAYHDARNRAARRRAPVARRTSAPAARTARRQAAPVTGLFVLGELSEELGTMRSKIAGRINETVFKNPTSDHGGLAALTSDVGLRVFVGPAGEQDADRGPRATILCTTCDLDTDRVSEERYHAAHCISEVCVKGENEGIFYNCVEHEPGQQREPLFLEQLERFDVFGR